MTNAELISLLIVAGVAIAAWLANRARAAETTAREEGQANPVGTAKLQRDMTSLSSKVTVIETRLGEIEKDIAASPTKADIEVLRGLIMTLAERTSGIGGHVESVDAAVVRIEMKLDNLSPAPITRTRSLK